MVPAFLVGAFLGKSARLLQWLVFFLFLVGAFLVKSARHLQWLVFIFFRQTTDLIAYVPLFTETDKTTQAKSGQCKLSAKGPPLIFNLFYVTYKTRRD